MNKASEAGEMQKEAVSLYCRLAHTRELDTRWLCSALFNYGYSCQSLGQHSEAVLACQESIPLMHALIAPDPCQARQMTYLHHCMANSLCALGQGTEAEAAATTALQMNHGCMLRKGGYAPDFRSCFVCQRAMFIAAPPASTPPPTEFKQLSKSNPPTSPAQSSTMATSAHTPCTNALGSVELTQPGVVPNPPAPLGSTVLSHLPSTHSQTRNMQVPLCSC
jgi:hypothetical protein